MTIATLTSKGQMTIPIDIRIYLGLHAGDKLAFIIGQDGHVMLEAVTTDVRQLKDVLPRPKKTITIEQMNESIAKRGAGERDRYKRLSTLSCSR